jgi:hypothetical protein
MPQFLIAERKPPRQLHSLAPLFFLSRSNQRLPMTVERSGIARFVFPGFPVPAGSFVPLFVLRRKIGRSGEEQLQPAMEVPGQFRYRQRTGTQARPQSFSHLDPPLPACA